MSEASRERLVGIADKQQYPEDHSFSLSKSLIKNIFCLGLGVLRKSICVKKISFN
ncbi:hypothetical protein lpa_03168 [Legionella pneumophila 2300/99 Alcoy]|nr:hypothetical protein lpa_03168 [Legionella pneumophila 2300/99 Alcoy]